MTCGVRSTRRAPRGEAATGTPDAPQTGASAGPHAAQPQTDSAPKASAGKGETKAAAPAEDDLDTALAEAGATELAAVNTLLDGLKIVAQNGEAKDRAERLAVGQAPVVFDTADSPACTDCGSIMVRNGSCYKCINCGATSGCS